MGSALKKAIGGLKIDSILQFELDFEIVWYKFIMKNYIDITRQELVWEWFRNGGWLLISFLNQSEGNIHGRWTGLLRQLNRSLPLINPFLLVHC